MELVHGQQLVGRTVFNRTSGLELGRVTGVSLKGQTVYLTVSLAREGRPGGQVSVPLQEVTVGAALTVSDETVAGVEDEPEGQGGAALAALNSRRVVTTAGREVGQVQDLVLDPAAGVPVALAVSDGILVDLLRGWRQVPLEKVTSIGEDAVVVADDFASEGGSDLV